MMNHEDFRAGLGKLYRGFDRKPPSEEKIDSLYHHLKKFHTSAWDRAVRSLLCLSTFPSFADIKLECSEWQRRQGEDELESEYRRRELEYLGEQLRRFNARSKSADADFAVPYLQLSIEDHVRNPSGKLPSVETSNPHFAMLCAQSIAIWMAGAKPEDIATWLESKRDGCVVNLDAQIYAVRGLPLYRKGAAI